MRLHHLCTIVALFVGLTVRSAYAFDAVVLDRGKDHPAILLPVPHGAHPKQAPSLFLQAIRKKTNLNAVLNVAQFPSNVDTILSLSQFIQRHVRTPLVTVEASNFAQVQPKPGSSSYQTFEQLRSRGLTEVIIPPAATAGLSEAEAKEFRRTIAPLTNGFIELGGDDPHPETYGSEITHARNVSFERDSDSLKMIGAMIENSDAPVFAICRGHELCAIRHGHQLTQDIQIESSASQDHLDGWHRIRIDKNSELYKIVGQNEIEVYSYHHQAVAARSGSSFRTTAISVDDPSPVIEAAEFANGRGMSFQFHPELMEGEVRKQIFDSFAQRVFENHAGRIKTSCSLVRNLRKILR